jgi:hypothetical protein
LSSSSFLVMIGAGFALTGVAKILRIPLGDGDLSATMRGRENWCEEATALGPGFRIMRGDDGGMAGSSS